MNNFLALCRKECATVFFSPMAYVVLAVFACLMAYTFCAQLFHTQSTSLIAMYYQAASLLLLFLPLMTMRLIAEERTSGTLELLMASAASERAIVGAKFFASLVLVALMLATVLVFPFVLSFYTSIDWGPVASAMLGLSLLGASLAAIGLGVSSLSSNQLVAGLLSLGVGLMLWMAEVLGVYLPAPLDHAAISLSFDVRLTPFVTGVAYFSDIAFFLSISAAFLLLATLALSRR